jgi:hypothetical protein
MTRFLILFLIAVAIGAARPAEAKGTPSTGGDPRPSRKLDFEDGVVEGLNKRPLDAFNQFSEADKRSKIPHLYKKRTGFSQETADTLKTVRYSQ